MVNQPVRQSGLVHTSVLVPNPGGPFSPTPSLLPHTSPNGLCPELVLSRWRVSLDNLMDPSALRQETHCAKAPCPMQRACLLCSLTMTFLAELL